MRRRFLALGLSAAVGALAWLAWPAVGPHLSGSADRSGDELEPLQVRGRVIAGGLPVSGALVSVHRGFGPDLHLSTEGAPRLSFGSEATVRTNDDGEYVLPLCEKAPYLVRAEAPGYAPAGLSLGPPPRGRHEQHVLELHPGGVIEGVVLVPAGMEASGMLVSVSRADLEPSTQRSDAEGRFRFEDLAPGRWLVERREEHEGVVGVQYFRGAGEGPRWSCEVLSGTTTRFDLDLRDVKTCAVEGRLTVHGKTTEGWYAELFDPYRTGPLDSALLDQDGRFRIAAKGAGLRRLVVRPSEHASYGFWQIVDLQGEVTTWELEVSSGKLAGTAPAAEETFYIIQEVAGRNGGYYASIEASNGGDFAVEVAPTGDLAVVNGRHGAVDREVRVKKGRTTRIDLR